MNATNQAARDRRAAEEAISVMLERLSDPLLVEDFACAANYSKFHFCRLFRKATGVTPIRFLSALRLKESRRLMLTSRLTVVDISCSVGYNSVGTFTSRFTRSVGISPSVFRRNGGFSTVPLGPAADPQLRRPGRLEGSTLTGTVTVPHELRPERIVLAAFPTPVPEGRPLHYTTLSEPGPWRLPMVGDGSWYVVAAAVGADDRDDPDSPLFERQTHFLGRTRAVTVRAGEPVRPVQVRIRPARLTDPPILFAPPRPCVVPGLAEALDLSA